MFKCPAWSLSIIDEMKERKRKLDPYPFDNPVDSSIHLNCHLNDYLRLSGNSEVIEAKNKATEETGSGALASIVYSGDHDYHRDFRALVAQSAECNSPECVLLTSSGWTANVGVMEAIIQPDMPVYIDAMAHASLFDGVRLSPGKLIPLRHNRPESAEKLIEMYGPGIIVVDAFYSTYGSMVPLEEYVKLAEKYDCLLVLDEAHSFAMTGKGGGLAVEKGLADRVHIRTVSLAKGIGGSGGLIISNEDMIFYLQHRMRPVIFSSFPAPSVSAGNLKALQIVRKEPERAERTLNNAAYFRKLLNENDVDTGPSACQVVSLLFDSEVDTCKLYGELRKEGILFSVFIYPAVAKDCGLARFSIYTLLNEKDIEYIAEKTIKAMHALKIKSQYPKRMRSL